MQQYLKNWFLTTKILTTDSIENLSDNVELETWDGQLLLTTSTYLENLVNSILRNLQHCDCENETELNFVPQNKTVEEFEFEWSSVVDVWKSQLEG